MQKQILTLLPCLGFKGDDQLADNGNYSCNDPDSSSYKKSKRVLHKFSEAKQKAIVGTDQALKASCGNDKTISFIAVIDHFFTLTLPETADSLTSRIKNTFQVRSRALLVSIFLSGISQADDNTGLYLGSKVGWSYFEHACESQSIDCNKGALGGGAYLGYQFNDWLSIESGYDYFGKVNAVFPALGNASVQAPYQTELQGIELGLIAEYMPHYSDWGIFGKVGSLGWQVDKIGQELNGQIKLRDENVSLMLGTGLEYHLTSALSARLEYQWFSKVGGDRTGGSDIHFATMGLNYSFGGWKERESISCEQEVNMPPDLLLLFEIDSAIIGPVEELMLESVVSRLQSSLSTTVTVVGYTDSLGSAAYNRRLSEFRAESVKYYLISEGIAPRRIESKGKGERCPVISNMTKRGRSMNRRVEIYVSEAPILTILHENT